MQETQLRDEFDRSSRVCKVPDALRTVYVTPQGLRRLTPIKNRRLRRQLRQGLRGFLRRVGTDALDDSVRAFTGELLGRNGLTNLAAGVLGQVRQPGFEPSGRVLTSVEFDLMRFGTKSAMAFFEALHL